MHLNINSVFNKFEHVFSILNSLDFDIIALNEIKLDDSVPSKLYEHEKYNLIRRDRNSSGGGIMVYIKKCYSILDYESSTDYEIISFKLLVKRIANNFIFSYKPPNVNDHDYLEHLDSVIKLKNLNNNLFIIGDLNMDWQSTKGDSLKAFCSDNGLYNFVNEPTRVFVGKNHISSTLIDVVLHNGSSIIDTFAVDFPYSDHKLVVTTWNFQSESIKSTSNYKRKLNDKAIDLIIKDLSITDFKFFNEVQDSELRYFFFKKLIMEVLNKHAPLKLTSNNRKVKQLPWFDRDLLLLRRKCDNLYAKFKKSNDLLDKEIFTEQRNIYQKLLYLEN
jgi:exonuclease III